MERIFGNSERIFINNKMQCSCQCFYCYLPKLTKTKDREIWSGEKMAKSVTNFNSFVPGKVGTIITIGCYSECFDKDVIDETIDTILLLAKYQNPIQLATKREINKNKMKLLEGAARWKNQITINVSIPIISNSSKLEKGTDLPERRFKNFETLEKIGVPASLFIKPVLKGITFQDKEKYVAFIKQHKIQNVIVGGYYDLAEKNDIGEAPIGDGSLGEKWNDERFQLQQYLSKFAKTYEHSIDWINFERFGTREK